MLVVGLVAAPAYGAGVVLRHHDQRTVAALRPARPRARLGTRRPPTPRRPADPHRPRARRRPRRSPGPADDVLQPGAAAPRCASSRSRLHQLAWLPETTTGVYDDATVAAVKGFQAKRGLEPHRRPGPAYLAAAGGDDRRRPATTRCSTCCTPGRTLVGRATTAPTSATSRPGSSRSRGTSATSPAPTTPRPSPRCKGFQAKRGIPVTGEVDQRTLDRLAAMTATPDPRRAAQHRSPSARRSSTRAASPGACCASTRPAAPCAGSSTARAADAGRPLRLDVNDTPTREGLFHVYLKDADHVSQLYGSSMPYSMFFSGGQAVHYSSDFAAVRLRRRVARLREHPRLRRRPVAVLPGAGRRQGRRLLVLTDARRASGATPAYARPS